MDRSKPLAVGDVIHGYARGAFGRDHYDCTKIEAAGRDWIVARDVNGDLSFASGESSLKHLIRVRDEDSCTESVCPAAGTNFGLTTPGGY